MDERFIRGFFFGVEGDGPARDSWSGDRGDRGDDDNARSLKPAVKGVSIVAERISSASR